jgi:hypothetical protein
VQNGYFVNAMLQKSLILMVVLYWHFTMVYMCLAACTEQRGVAEGLTAPKKHPYGNLSISIKYSYIISSRLKWFTFPSVDFATQDVVEDDRLLIRTSGADLFDNNLFANLFYHLVLMTRYLLNYIVRSGLSSNFFSIFCCF